MQRTDRRSRLPQDDRPIGEPQERPTARDEEPRHGGNVATRQQRQAAYDSTAQHMTHDDTQQGRGSSLCTDPRAGRSNRPESPFSQVGKMPIIYIMLTRPEESLLRRLRQGCPAGSKVLACLGGAQPHGPADSPACIGGVDLSPAARRLGRTPRLGAPATAELRRHASRVRHTTRRDADTAAAVRSECETHTGRRAAEPWTFDATPWTGCRTSPVPRGGMRPRRCAPPLPHLMDNHRYPSNMLVHNNFHSQNR